MDFGALKNDKDFIEKVTNLNKSLDEINNQIQAACDFPNYDELNQEDKVQFDLFLSYSINSLFWMLCKLQSIDPNEHGIKNELSRVRQAMVRDKEIRERKTLRPHLDVKAAGRFIRSGLWNLKDKQTDRQLLGPKKRKFDDDET